jgi:hypothetical protein
MYGMAGFPLLVGIAEQQMIDPDPERTRRIVEKLSRRNPTGRVEGHEGRICHEFPLREKFLAQAVLPRDLTAFEAAKLCAFVMTLVQPDMPSGMETTATVTGEIVARRTFALNLKLGREGATDRASVRAFHDLAEKLEIELAEMRRYLLLTLEQGNDLLPQDVRRAYELCEKGTK